MKNVPKEIFLQVGEDIEPDEDFMPCYYVGEVTWEIDRIHDSDIRYVLPSDSKLLKEITNKWTKRFLALPNNTGDGMPYRIIKELIEDLKSLREV